MNTVETFIAVGIGGIGVGIGLVLGAVLARGLIRFAYGQKNNHDRH